MNPHDYCKYAKWCNDRGIKIYPIPQDNKGMRLKIAMYNERNNREKIGDKTFENKKVYSKIAELYKEIYDKNNP